MASKETSTISPVSQGNLFACTKCSKTFSRPENLARHQKTHDVAKSHHCSFCSKSFTRSDLRKRHESLHQSKPSNLQLRSQDARPGKRQKIHSETPRVPVSLDAQVPSYTDTTPDFLPGTTPTEPWRHVAYLPFDFTSLLAPDYSLEQHMDDWFPGEFYAALQETGNDWNEFGLTPNTDLYTISTIESGELQTYDVVERQQVTEKSQSSMVAGTKIYDENQVARISQVSSPPNEESEEDKWPFAWNPRSRPVLDAEPIIFPEDDHLFKTHSPRYDVSETTYRKMLECIIFARDNCCASSQRSSFSLPSLPVVNVFIGIFFNSFYPQMPAIHLPTLNTNEDLPPPLLAAMVVIGAIYSNRQHTRRFAIVLLDLVRRSLLLGVEYDNSLMRDPMIIYALLLVCHTGLWCGNKRAFEFAEVVRGSVISYCRRSGFGETPSRRQTPGHESSPDRPSLESQWRHWIRAESRKRLCWLIYTLDCQFPSILNLPVTISATELANLGLPCDEEFWNSPTARLWKRLLGPASVPPSRPFAAAVGPFVVPPVGAINLPGPRYTDQSEEDGPQTMTLNTWSQFLVLSMIHVQIYEFAQEIQLVAKICGDENESHTPTVREGSGQLTCAEQLELQSLSSELVNNLPESFHPNLTDQMRLRLNGSLETTAWSVWKRLGEKKSQISASLQRWAQSYSQGLPTDFNKNTSSPFQEWSSHLYNLGNLILEISITDLQNALGKSGASGIPPAMANLSRWVTNNPQFLDSALIAIRTIHSLTPTTDEGTQDRNRGMNTSPYSVITFFLCHIALWAFASVATSSQRHELQNAIEKDERLKSWTICAVMRRALDDADAVGGQGDSNGRICSPAAPKIIFRSAAEVLVRMGTWGSTLNLAMLLHQRAEM